MSPAGTVDGPPPPDEHARFVHYLHVLAQAPDVEELALVAVVLGDPDQAMAQSAVTRHLDLRATALHQGPEYSAWEQRMESAVDRHPSATQRLRKWSLFRAITLATPWSPNALIAASDWLQHKVAESATSPKALAILAEAGRTRRVRNTAKSKLNSKPR